MQFKELENIIEQLNCEKKDEIIKIVNRLNQIVEKSFKVLGEYEEIENHDIGELSLVEYDCCGNNNYTKYTFAYENGQFIQIKSLSGGSDCWNHYKGNYIDVLNVEELIDLLENMSCVLSENVAKLSLAKAEEENYERRINKILHKNDWKALAKLSKEYCIII